MTATATAITQTAVDASAIQHAFQAGFFISWAMDIGNRIGQRASK